MSERQKLFHSMNFTAAKTTVFELLPFFGCLVFGFSLYFLKALAK
uniref:Uncharacterized protein n=1 Tax=Anguilla anguilla TaxID=7936 RepID=A0A0E9U6X3_ANGAN